jgi:hypothetical protein
MLITKRELEEQLFAWFKQQNGYTLDTSGMVYDKPAEDYLSVVGTFSIKDLAEFISKITV